MKNPDVPAVKRQADEDWGKGRDGQRVRLGEVVLRLDETITRANLAIVTKGLDEMTARQARLASERDQAEQVAFPATLLARANEPDVAAAIQSERKLFELRRSARLGQKSQLRERIGQLDEEVRGYTALQEAKAEEIELIQRELEGVRSLWNKNLVQINRLISLEREAARLKGERAQSVAAIAQSRGKIGEIELQIIQIDQDLSSEVARELREVEGKIGEFIERKVAAEDQLKRVEIRAPQNGVVHQLAVHTVGGVVSASDPIMLIVPEADAFRHGDVSLVGQQILQEDLQSRIPPRTWAWPGRNLPLVRLPSRRVGFKLLLHSCIVIDGIGAALNPALAARATLSSTAAMRQSAKSRSVSDISDALVDPEIARRRMHGNRYRVGRAFSLRCRADSDRNLHEIAA